MSVSSIGSSALSGELLSFLNSGLSSSGITPKSAAGEVTTQTPGGGSITTIGQGANANVISDTSANGTTVTEVGYLSPDLMQRFLDSLQQALQTTGAGTDANPSSIQALMNRLDDTGSSGAQNSQLLANFSDLLQGSGIETTAQGPTGGAGAKTALQAFLANTLSQLNTGSVGNNISTTA
jgi:hypothetical protein